MNAICYFVFFLNKSHLQRTISVFEAVLAHSSTECLPGTLGKYPLSTLHIITWLVLCSDYHIHIHIQCMHDSLSRCTAVTGSILEASFIKKEQIYSGSTHSFHNNLTPC